MVKYYTYYGDAGFAGTSTYGFVKVEGETAEKCDKTMQDFVDDIEATLKDDYSHLIDYPYAEDYDDEKDYEEACREAEEAYEENICCYYDDITDNIIDGIAFKYSYNICSTAIAEPEDFEYLQWEEI